MTVADVLAGIDSGIRWFVERSGAFTALAAITGAVVAIFGVRKWHIEGVGRRKIELAEDVLADVYKARDVIVWARTSSGFEGEGSTRPREEGETEGERSMKDSFYARVERLQKEKELFAQIAARKYRAMAYFGSDVEKDFQDLRMVQRRIIMAAISLVKYHRHYAASKPPSSWDKWLATIGWGLDPEQKDEVQTELDRIVKSFEDRFGRWLKRE